MEQETHQICSERPSWSLLILNDDCLRDIFNFLQLQDFVSLAVTCSRLLWVAQQIKKYKNIAVTRYGNERSYTVPEFAKTLAVIGENVASVRVHGTFAILKTTADAKLGIAELDSYYSGQIDRQLDSYESKSLHGLLPFRNLKELKLGSGNALSTDDWRNCFENNRGIESLAYWDGGRSNCLPLLQMLPELKSLTIKDLELKPEEFHHMSGLKRLKKLSFSCEATCDRFLIELSGRLNLVELEFTMLCDADTFAIVKTFSHLEVLSIVNWTQHFRISEHVIFPTMLKKIKLDGFGMFCSKFLSIVKQLPLLEEFDIGIGGAILWDNDEFEKFPKSPYQLIDIQGSEIISGIAKELRIEKRKLKIIFNCNGSNDNQICKYFDNLEIIIKPPRDVERSSDHTFRLPKQ